MFSSLRRFGVVLGISNTITWMQIATLAAHFGFLVYFVLELNGGVDGAAWATFSNYFINLFLVLIYYRFSKNEAC